MLTFKLKEDDREIVVRSHAEDITWTEAVHQMVVFLHACGYVFDRDEVVEMAEEFKEEFKEEIQEVEQRADGEPF